MKRVPISYPDLEKQEQLIKEALSLSDSYYAASRDDQIRMATLAVRKRFWEEQAERNQRAKKEFMRFFRQLMNV